MIPHVFHIPLCISPSATNSKRRTLSYSYGNVTTFHAQFVQVRMARRQTFRKNRTGHSGTANPASVYRQPVQVDGKSLAEDKIARV